MSRTILWFAFAVFIPTLLILWLGGDLLAQAKPLRPQKVDTAFVVNVELADGTTKPVAIAGFERFGLQTSCVLVSESGDLAVVPGNCPSR